MSFFFPRWLVAKNFAANIGREFLSHPNASMPFKSSGQSTSTAIASI